MQSSFPRIHRSAAIIVGPPEGTTSWPKGTSPIQTDPLLDSRPIQFSRDVPSQSGEIKVAAISEVIRRMTNDGILDLSKLDCEGAERKILKDAEGWNESPT
jgi:hypothetical protein